MGRLAAELGIQQTPPAPAATVGAPGSCVDNPFPSPNHVNAVGHGKRQNGDTAGSAVQ